MSNIPFFIQVAIDKNELLLINELLLLIFYFPFCELTSSFKMTILKISWKLDRACYFDPNSIIIV